MSFLNTGGENVLLWREYYIVIQDKTNINLLVVNILLCIFDKMILKYFEKK